MFVYLCNPQTHVGLFSAKTSLLLYHEKQFLFVVAVVSFVCVS